MTQEIAFGRRNLIRMSGVAGAGVVAGCLGDSGDAGDGREREDNGVEPIADDWQAETITDVTTGEQFSIAGLATPVLLHTFATNCLTCASQQDEFAAFLSSHDDVSIVELTTDPDLDADRIAAHADEEGLDWRVGVPSERILGALIDAFGTEVSVSAQSPVIVTCPDGTTDALSKVADPDELEGALEDVC